MEKKIGLAIGFCILVFTLFGWLFFANNQIYLKPSVKPTIPPSPTQEVKPSIANPASVNCNDKGGNLIMKKKPSGGEYGICVFEDNLQCEEWALFRGECPQDGVKITGFTSDAQIYCAITGGRYIANNESTDKGNCQLSNGEMCNLDEYYAGSCTQTSGDTKNEEVVAQAKFNCDENKVIRTVFYKSRVNLSLSDGRVLNLNQAMSGSGARYTNTDETTVFWNKGNTATLDENKKTTFANCVQE